MSHFITYDRFGKAVGSWLWSMSKAIFRLGIDPTGRSVVKAPDADSVAVASRDHKCSDAASRIEVKGKHFYCDGEKIFIKGVTYGTFAPDADGFQFPSVEVMKDDLARMSANGINSVRTYTVPPRAFLDLAHAFGIRVMVGLPWEQHITFLDGRSRQQSILENIRRYVLQCKGHPAVFSYAIGNEIPSGIVRWYGAHRIEAFLKKLYRQVKAIDPSALVTYVNYPTTEFLDLSFLDFYSFNVYLEQKEKFEKYLQRLHNLIGEKPLLLAEIGLDSLRNSPSKQAEAIEWQLASIFSKGCAGSFVFAWTDEWWRGGHPIEDWDFGLVDRSRDPKPALKVVKRCYDQLPFPSIRKWPYISVVVCTYNGSATIRDCMEGLMKLAYPCYEVIVINDGSTDHTSRIVSEYPVRLINTTNQGLSQARNRGIQESNGEIIAYIDDDAYPDPHWLHYLAYAYTHSDHAGIGGPNIPPPEDGPIALSVANAPGGPVHVLVTDEIAEHIPGCNMSFRKEALLAVGGFDPQYRAAGDDVDLCWRIQLIGYTIGYHPAAVVWHHRRNSVKAYWRQQMGYGKAEALLENKWPEKYNEFGHVSWAGRIYGNGLTRPISFQKDKVYHGVWGSAAYQSVYSSGNATLSSLPLMPEWNIIILLLASLSMLGVKWPMLLWAIPVLVIAVLLIVFQAGFSSARALRSMRIASSYRRGKFFLMITLLHIIQPFARLYGRLLFGLTPWRRRGSVSFRFRSLFRREMVLHHWSETWRSSEEWLQLIEAQLIESRARVRRGGNYDVWDIQTSSGLLSAARALLVIEEHGAGKQMLKFRCWITYSQIGLIFTMVFVLLSGMAWWDNAPIISGLLATISALFFFRFMFDHANVMNEIHQAFLSITNDMHVTEKKAQVSKTLPAAEGNTASGKLCKGYPELISKYIQAGITEDGTVLNGYVHQTSAPGIDIKD
jgi:GT2 family glycosyltransferase